MREAERPMEKGSTDQRSEGPGKAQPSHSWLGHLFSHGCRQRNLWQARCVDVLQDHPLYQTHASQQIGRLATTQILGSVQSGQASLRDVWRQTDRSLPAQVYLVSSRST